MTTAKSQTHIVKEALYTYFIKPLLWIGGLVVAILLGGIAIRMLKPKWL